MDHTSANTLVSINQLNFSACRKVSHKGGIKYISTLDDDEEEEHDDCDGMI